MSGMNIDFNKLKQINPFASPEKIGMEPNHQGQDDKKVEQKKQEIAKLTEDSMQELEIDEGSNQNLFLDDLKKKLG